MHTLRVMRVKPGLRRSFHHPRSPACGAVENKKKHAGCGICDSGLHAVCRARHPETGAGRAAHFNAQALRPGGDSAWPPRVPPVARCFVFFYHRLSPEAILINSCCAKTFSPLPSVGQGRVGTRACNSRKPWGQEERRFVCRAQEGQGEMLVSCLSFLPRGLKQ